MGFLQTLTGKVVAIVVAVAAVVLLVFVVMKNWPRPSDSPSDVSNLLPPSDPNVPVVKPGPGDAVGVGPGQGGMRGK